MIIWNKPADLPNQSGFTFVALLHSMRQVKLITRGSNQTGFTIVGGDRVYRLIKAWRKL